MRSINGYSCEVAWDKPVVARGVMEKYVLKAYSWDDPHLLGMPSASAEFVNTSAISGKGNSAMECLLLIF